jgi:hypothetical protein
MTKDGEGKEESRLAGPSGLHSWVDGGSDPSQACRGRHRCRPENSGLGSGHFTLETPGRHPRKRIGS